MKCFLQLAALFTLISSPLGAIKTETVEYKEGDVTLEGVLVYDDSVAALRPGILVVHQWRALRITNANAPKCSLNSAMSASPRKFTAELFALPIRKQPVNWPADFSGDSGFAIGC